MYAKDKIFVDEFNGMIKRFQLEILDFTIQYVDEQLDDLENSILAKIKMIERCKIYLRHISKICQKFSEIR
jgi:hypothetical protein